jgi:ubiquinone/menaquinone biosynthesis C-methylase UbiE
MSEGSFLSPTEALEPLELHAGMRIADLAASSGFFARAAARIAAPGEVWAVDPNPDLLRRLKTIAEGEGLRNIEVMRGDIEKPRGSNLPDNTFDAILLVNRLFAAGNKGAIAAEANRICKRGGVVLLIDWTDSFSGLGPHPDHVVGKADARTLFEAAGFAPVGAAPAGAYHWGLIMTKQ